MSWVSVNDRFPKPFTRVWLMTDSGKQTTGYIKPNGEWVISCARIAAEQPKIIRWRE